MTSTRSPLRIGNVSASRADRATATAEFLTAATLDVLESLERSAANRQPRAPPQVA